MNQANRSMRRRASVGLFLYLLVIGWLLLPHRSPPVIFWGEPLAYPEPFLAGGWHPDLNEAGNVVVRGLILNESPRPWRDLHVRVPCYDENHRFLGWADAYRAMLSPGENWRFTAWQFGLNRTVTCGRPIVEGYH